MASEDRAEPLVKLLDGIDSPEGKDVNIAGKTVKVYNFDQIHHANADALFSISLDEMRKNFEAILPQLIGESSWLVNPSCSSRSNFRRRLPGLSAKGVIQILNTQAPPTASHRFSHEKAA